MAAGDAPTRPTTAPNSGELSAQPENQEPQLEEQFWTAAAKGDPVAETLARAHADAEAAAEERKIPQASDLAAMVAEVEKLNDTDYELKRRELAKRFGIRVTWLDSIRFKAQHGNGDGRAPGGGRKLEIQEPEPWPTAVSTSELLSEVQERIRRYVVMPAASCLACALYVLVSYCAPKLYLIPLLVIRSAMKRSGKTTLLDVLGKLLCRALAVVSLTEAVLFRVVEALRPSLLFDEADAFFGQKSERTEPIRALLNAGHTRTASVVPRCEGKADGSFEVVGFDVFGPKVLAAIGKMPDTIEDRAITIVQRRKLPSEKVDRFSLLSGQEEWTALRARLMRWAQDYAEEVARARPALPDQLHDRALDNWTPLVAVADLAGAEIGAAARLAASTLSKEGEEDAGHKVELLRDILSIFAEGNRVRGGQHGEERITTADLLQLLKDREESPWAAWNKGKGLDARSLARLLKDFEIKSVDIKLYEGATERVLKGYVRSAFADTWTRYLGGTGETERYSATESGNSIQDKDLAGSGKGSGSAGDALPPGRVADGEGYRYPSATEADQGKLFPDKEIEHTADAGSAVAQENPPAGEDQPPLDSYEGQVPAELDIW